MQPIFSRMTIYALLIIMLFAATKVKDKLAIDSTLIWNCTIHRRAIILLASISSSSSGTKTDYLTAFSPCPTTISNLSLDSIIQIFDITWILEERLSIKYLF